jgi:sirohydrochlorin cobaltochelatase
MTRTALILAGHGSHISPDTAGLVWSYVDQLREWGVADEVTACFWKEMPSFHHVLDTVTAEDITIVPVFTARGYFATTAIPAEMDLDGEITRRDGRIIRYSKTLGDHPHLAKIVQKRVTDALENYHLDPKLVAVAVIGHGTPRNRHSRDVTCDQAEQLRDQNLVREVVDVYLDDEPFIPSIYQTTQSPNIIAVPNFLATGSHTTIDVPKALGIQLDVNPSNVNGRQVFYTSPIGTDDVVCDLILDLARETGQPFEIQPERDVWSGFPQRGRDELINAVQTEGILSFGQLQLSPTEIHPLESAENPIVLETPVSLRKFVREEPFRPLATASNLPTGWRVPISSPEILYPIVETIYPGTVADWAAYQKGEFQSESLSYVAQFQTGMFKDIDRLASSAVENLVGEICGNCVCHPMWLHGESPPNAIPCKSPCNFWLSRAKETH